MFLLFANNYKIMESFFVWLQIGITAFVIPINIFEKF